MEIKEVMQKMVSENLTIRQMAKILGVAKSTLYSRIEAYKSVCTDLPLLYAYESLMSGNKISATINGGNTTKSLYKGTRKK